MREIRVPIKSPSLRSGRRYRRGGPHRRGPRRGLGGASGSLFRPVPVENRMGPAYWERVLATAGEIHERAGGAPLGLRTPKVGLASTVLEVGVTPYLRILLIFCYFTNTY